METNRPIAIVMLIVIAAIVTFLFAIPQFQRAQALEVEFFQRQADYQGRSQYQQQVSQAMSDLSRKSASMAKVESAIPQGFLVASIVNFFQQQEVPSGVRINSVELSPNSLTSAFVGQGEDSPTSLDDLKNIIFSVEISGNYAAIKRFVNSIEQSARLFEIISISIKPVAPLGSKNPALVHRVTLEIQAHAY